MGSPLSPGTKLDRFEIVSQLGAGGMGEVYLAEDSRLHRKVALKVLPLEVAAHHDRMRRFIQEATAAASLNHPNIAHIYETGEATPRPPAGSDEPPQREAGAGELLAAPARRSGQPGEVLHFIVMEFVEGVTLREKIHRQHSDLRKLLRYLQQVAEGLAKAHAAGVVHRDLKPDNIMITGEGHAKILDFGLAKLVEPALSPLTSEAGSSEVATAVMPQQHSTPGTVLGTVGYMSPEQAQGKTGEIDHRSDIFSFGCILFEAVTGRKAFEGSDAIDTLNKIIRESVPSITDFRAAAPNHLQRIVRRCLEKDPEDRYQTIKDVAIELRDLRRELAPGAGIDVTVPPSATSSRQDTDFLNSPIPSGATRASSAEYVLSGIGNHKLAASLGFLVLVIGIIAVAVYVHSRNTETAIDSIAVLPFQNRSSETDTEYLSDGLAESLIYRLSLLPHLRVSPTSSVFRYKGKEIDPVKVGQELGVNAVLSGRIVQRGDQLTISAELVDVRNNRLLWGEQYDRKVSDLLATQREIAREIVEKLKLKVSGEEKGLAKHYTESNEAYQLYLKGRFYWNKRTEEGLQKALDNFQQAIEKDPNFALAYSGLADTYDLLGAVDAGGTMAPNDALPKAKIAALKAMAIDQTLAEPHVSLAHARYLYDRDWVTAEREFNRAIELNPNYPQAHHWYAIYLAWAGRSDQAVAEARRALELDPLSLPINMTLGWVLCIGRQEDQGIEQLRKTIEMDPNFVIAHHRLGLGYEQKGMYSEAIAEFQKLYHLPGGKQIAVAALGHAYAASGKREDAQKAIAELQELSKQRYVSAASIAIIYAALGDKDQAFAWLGKADKDHDLGFSRLKVEPRFDSLRSDHRFADLVRRVGLTQ